MLKKRILSSVLSLTMLASCMTALNISASAVEQADYILWSAEFDGNDDTSLWTKVDSGNKIFKADFADYVIDGNLELDPYAVSSGKFMADGRCILAEGEAAIENGTDITSRTPQAIVNVAGKEDVVWETRFKVDIPDNVTLNDNQFIYLRDHHQNYTVYTAIREGKIAYGGTEATSTYVSDYALKDNVWTTMTIHMNFTNGTMKMILTDEEGGGFIGDYTKMAYGLTLTDIYTISLVRQLSNIKTSFDYSRIWDNTLLPDVVVTDNDGEVLDNAVDVPKNVSAILTFENSITEEDLQKITVDKGAVVEKVLMEGGNAAVLNISGLMGNTAYNINIPTLAYNRGKVVTFSTEMEEWLIFDAEMNGTESRNNWSGFDSGADVKNTDIVTLQPVDGALKYNKQTSGTGAWGVNFDPPYAVDSTKEAITMTSRFKVDKAVNNRLFSFVGLRASDDYRIEFGGVQIKDGYFGLAAPNNGQSTEIGSLQAEAGVWYKIKAIINYKSRKYTVTITDENGNSATMERGFLWGIEIKDLCSIAAIRTEWFPDNDTYAYIDYFRLWDGSRTDIPTPAVTVGEESLNNMVNVPVTGITATANFAYAIEESDLSAITINNGAVIEKTLSQDGKSVTLNISGLEKLTEYTLSIGDCGLNIGDTFKFVTADDPWYILKATFDADDLKAGWHWEKDVSGLTQAERTITPTYNSDGTISLIKNTFSYQTAQIVLDKPVDITGKTDIIVESRFKLTGEGLVDTGKPIFALRQMDNEYRNAGICLTADNNYVALSGNKRDNANNITSFVINRNEYYTYRMKFNAATQTYVVSIMNDDGTQSYESEEIPAVVWQNDWPINQIDAVQFGYTAQSEAVVDYVTIIDNSLIPSVTAVRAAYNESLDGVGNVKNGEEININFVFPVTADQLTGITLDNNAVDTVLAEDGMSAALTLNNIGYRQMHTLTVPQIGENKPIEFNFRSADEGKYLLRAEFDGSDDNNPLFFNLNNQRYEEVTSNFISDGILSYGPSNNIYRGFYAGFERLNESDVMSHEIPGSYKLDCTGKKNISIETKMKFGEGVIDVQTLYLYDNIAMIRVDENRVIRYNGNAGNDESSIGSPFMVNDVEYVIEPDVWYSIVMNFDFVAQRYSVSIDDGKGNIASSGTLSFIYRAPKYEIKGLRLPRMLSNTAAPVSVDYVRIIDKDYGKGEVTSVNMGINLEDAAMVLVDDQFTFTVSEGEYDLTAIRLVDEDGNDAQITASYDAGVVTVTPAAMNYNTKYSLIIPKEILGADDDQIVNFTTIWNENEEFTYPDGYTADDELSVVFFGGSITNMDGWRVHTTDWFNEYFPNATCYNASVGGTGAEYGWQRLGRDVASKNPDVVFVEFAVNDSTNPEAGKSIESIVRTLNNLPKKPVIIFVYTTVLDFNTNTFAIAEQEKVAKAYGIPSINVHDYMKTLYNMDETLAEDWNNKVYLPDGTHPSTDCSKLYGAYVTTLLSTDSSKYFVKPAANDAVTALHNSKDYMYSYDATNVVLNNVGDTHTFDFEGDEVIIEVKKGREFGIFKAEVDGVVVEENIDMYIDGNYPSAHLLYTGFGQGSHTLKITVTGKNDKAAASTIDVTSIFWREGVSQSVFNAPVFESDTVTAGTLLNVSVDYLTSASEDVAVVIALYDKDGKLTRMQCTELKTDATTETKTIETGITPLAGDEKAKAFVWDGLNTMNPLAPATGIGF